MTDHDPAGPGPESIVDHITRTYPETDVVTIPGAWFFSLDPEKHWPNYATIVTTDEHDMEPVSDLARDGVFRLNLGVDKATFERLVGGMTEPDYAAFDRILPHPVYASQRWISILNPSQGTFDDVVAPLITLAHDRLAAQRARHGLDRGAAEDEPPD
jgi:Family of unknown function (DUF6194)